MKINILLIFIFYSFNVYSQDRNPTKKDLLGKWYLIKTEKDTTTTFDSDNELNMRNNSFTRLKQYKPNYTKEDSLAQIALFNSLIENLRKSYIYFKEDNTFEVASPPRKPNEPLKVRNGEYKFDEKILLLTQIIQENSTDALVYIENNILKLSFVDGSGIYLSYRKSN